MLSLKKTQKEIVMEIRNKYCLKEDSFFPKKKSPNIFMKKLEWRLNNYFKVLNNLDDSNRKK